MSPIPLRALSPRPHLPHEDLAYCNNEAGERPQVLAQLAKDISDLIHSARSASSERRILREWGSPHVRPVAAQLPPGELTRHLDRFSSFELGLGAKEEAQEEASSCPKVRSPGQVEASSRTRARSPHGVHALLSNIESREAALHQKVQQLMEEKAKQQQHWEEEMARLQRSNALMEEELRKRHLADASKTETLTQREVAWPCEAVCDNTRTGARSPVETRTGSQMLPQDVREELQYQLSEIRAEVTRCAQALHAPEALPAAEMIDIRQQLAALSSEVLQTSRALLEGHGGGGVGCGRETEFSDVRRQLEALQAQVSNAMVAAFALPIKDANQTCQVISPRGAEISELRAEVSNLRAEIAQASRPCHGARASDASDLRTQIETLRMNIGELAHSAQKPPPAFSLQVSSLHGRLAALRAEVARVVQDPRYAEDSAPPALRAQLGTLLRELQDVRSGAAVVAAAVAPGRGVVLAPWHRHDGCQRNHHLTTSPLDPWRARPMEVGRPAVQQPVPTPSRCSGRSSDPERFVDVPLGISDWDAHAARSCDLVASASQPMLGAATPPLLLCPHLAADLASVSSNCGYGCGVDFIGTRGLLSTPVAGGPGTPALHRSVPSSGPASGRNSPRPPLTPLLSVGAVPGSALTRLQPTGSSRPWEQSADPLGTTVCGTMPMGSAGCGGLNGMSGAPASNIGGAWASQAHRCSGSGDVSGPPDEPLDRAPQGAMLRPTRTKIPRQDIPAWPMTRCL